MEFFGISLAAWMSILALTIVIVISCFFEELHVGLLSIAFAIIVGAIFMDDVGRKDRDGVPAEPLHDPGGCDLHVLHGPGKRHLGEDHVLLDQVVRRQHDAAALHHLLPDHFHHHDRPGKHRRCRTAGPHLHGHRRPRGDVGFLHDAHRRGRRQLGRFSPFAPTGIISHGLIGRMADQIPNLWANWSHPHPWTGRSTSTP